MQTSVRCTPCRMTAGEWLKLQLRTPQRLRITDLHLEQLHSGAEDAADALQGYMHMNNFWDLCGVLTSLRFSIRWHIDNLTVRTPHHGICCCRCCYYVLLVV